MIALPVGPLLPSKNNKQVESKIKKCWTEQITYDTKWGEGHSVKLVCNYLLHMFIITVVLVILS